MRLRIWILLRRPAITRLVVVLIAVLTMPAGTGCDSLTQRRPPANVLLIVMDTVRADHLSCYGYPLPTTPAIDSLAARATLFSRAMAPAPWTLPTHASLFTGKDPFEHGAHRLGTDPGSQRLNPLHDGHVTLAEVFADAGYATAGFAANDGYLTPRWRLDRGFQTFVSARGRADEINASVVEWLRRNDGPFFLFVNYMDAHKPYNTSRWPDFLGPPVAADGDSLHDRLIEIVMVDGDPAPDGLVRRVSAQYDAALAFMDREIGSLLSFLERNDLNDNTLIIITSDHGEAFGEHGVVMHGRDVYQEQIHVPLVIKLPGQSEASRDERLLSLSDVPHLLLSAISNPELRGATKRFPNVPGNHPVIAENYYARTKRLFRAPVRTAVFDWPYKFIESTDGQSELYNLQDDPKEANNRLRFEPGTVKRLSEMLDAYRSERGRSDTVVEMPPLETEEIERLKALGYIVR